MVEETSDQCILQLSVLQKLNFIIFFKYQNFTLLRLWKLSRKSSFFHDVSFPSPEHFLAPLRSKLSTNDKKI